MLRQVIAILFASILLAPAVSAQSNSDIAKVKSGQSCMECNLFQADFSYQAIHGVDVSFSRLRQASMSLASMTGVNFSEANLSVANLFGGQFSDSNFADANLRDSTLVGAYFDGANFSGADLTGANLGGVDLRSAIGLTQRQLNKACGDKETQLRGGLTIPKCK